MKLNELIYGVLNLKGGGFLSDDLDLSEDQTIYIIDYYRGKLISQIYGKSGKSVETLYQVIEPKLEKIPDGEFEFAEFTHRSELIIPKVLVVDRPLIQYVGGGEGQFSYDIETKNTAATSKYARYSWPKVTLQEDKIFVKPIGSEGINVLTLMAIFEQPLDVYKFKGVTIPLDYDIEYPFPIRLVDTLYKMIAESELKLLETLNKKPINDSNED